MGRADSRRRLRRDRAHAKRQASDLAKTEVAARKLELSAAFADKHGLRLTTKEKLLLPFKFLADLMWWPIKIWLPDDHPGKHEHRSRRGDHV
jgi:hypothetical protein